MCNICQNNKVVNNVGYGYIIQPCPNLTAADRAGIQAEREKKKAAFRERLRIAQMKVYS